MDATSDTTATNSQHGAYRDQMAMRVWKLRVLYTGTRGVVAVEPRCWDGKFQINIGRRRSSESSQVLGPGLMLDDERVSRTHAEMKCDGQGVLIRDLDSKNGTQVNGRRLRSGEPWELEDGDLIRVGDSLLMLRHEQAPVADAPIPAIVGCSVVMCRLRSSLLPLARAERPVLILGDTGTGKEVVAQAIHRLSGRHGKLVAVDCSSLPSELAVAHFFGVLKGAYTGAAYQSGYLREAHEGTLLLDEVGDLPLGVQPKLLRALENRTMTPLGSGRPVPCDVRVVALSNRDLDDDLRLQRFQKGLYSRLSTDVVRLPSLRERREDVLLLAQHFGGVGFQPSPRLAEAMLRYDWPLNVREVQTMVQRVQREGEEAALRGLQAPPPIPIVRRDSAPQERPRPWNTGDPPPPRRQLVELLEKYHGSLRRIEIEVGYSRRQFRRWAEKYALDLSEFRSAAD